MARVVSAAGFARGAVRLLGEHWALALVLALAAALRVAVAVAYRPALFFIGDSWGYLERAYDHTFVGFGFGQPSGYPVVIKLLSYVTHDLAAITALQHVVGLATGVLVYALSRKLAVPHLLAAAAAAIVLFDSYTLALEQDVLSESVFALFLLVSAYLAVVARGPAALAASGLVLGGATTIRVVALFAIPVWLAYVAWRHRSWAAVASALVAVALPVVAYTAIHAGRGHGLSWTQFEGYVLYGRVARIADCSGAQIPADTRRLCEDDAERLERLRAGWEPSTYIFNPDSPARRAFPVFPSTEVNRRLRAFALAIIRAHPWDYLRTVSVEFLAYLRPDRSVPKSAVLLPDRDLPHEALVDESVDRHFPDYEQRLHPPARFLLRYQDVVHVSPVLLALLVFASVASVAVAAASRTVTLPHQAEVVFLVGTALTLSFAAVATVELTLRFLIPTLPLLVCGGALALVSLARAASATARVLPAGWRTRHLHR